MSLDQIVNINIRLESSGLSQPGFGTIMCAASLSSAVEAIWGNELSRTYTSAAAMLATAEGFTANDRAYKMVAKAFSQNPKPVQVKVGRRATAQTQVITLTPTKTTPGYIYSGKVQGQTWTYTVPAPTDNSVPVICAGIKAAIDALSVTGLTVATVGSPVTHLTATATAGLVLDYTKMSKYITVLDTTADPGIAADLTEIAAADNDWYMLLIDSTGSAENAAAAAWTEATRKIFVLQAADSECLTSSTTDQISDVKALAYFRTIPVWNQDVAATLAPALAANRATAIPGSDTWNGKQLTGVFPSDQLTDTQIGILKGKYATYYKTIGNTGRTQGGKVTSGEWADVVRFLDWTHATMQVNCINALYASEKVPNTNEGRAVISGEIDKTLDLGVRNGGFKRTPSYTITMPPDSDTTSFDPTTRTLSGVSWTAVLANAIHIIDPITGYVTND